MGQVTASNGIDITYTEHGDGDRGTLLLICGTGQPAAMWSALGVVDGLTADGYRVVTFDNRGMVGAACPTPPWTVGDMADDATTVLEAVGPAHILGASLGALIAQTVALRRPDFVRTATLMVGGGQFGAAWQYLMRAMTELLGRDEPLPADLQHFVMFQVMLNPEQRNDAAMIELAVALGGGFTDTFGPGGQLGQYSANTTWMSEDHVSELAGMRPPVLVLANQHDPIFPARDLAAVAAAVPDGTYVEIPDASHVAVDSTSLQLTMDSLLKFLAAH